MTLLASFALAACGVTAGTYSPSANSSIASISAVCTPSSIDPGGSSQCSAAVNGSGASSSAVTWSASAGTISPSGLFTAPASSGTVTITAASAQNSQVSAKTSVTVMADAAAPAPTVTGVTVKCTPSTMTVGTTSQCSATVQGTGNYNSAVSWSASAGTINASGLFTAPATAGTVTITATSTQNSQVSGTASITVNAAPPPPTVTGITVKCSPTTILENATSQCSATVQGTGSYSSAVSWTASAGSITSNGLFTAPATAGTVTVTATSTQFPNIAGTSQVTVQSPSPRSAVTSISVQCSPSAVPVGGTSQCKADVQGIGSYSLTVTWAASAGTINSGGLFTAPASAGTVTITATSTQDTQVSGKTTITVQPPKNHVVIVMEENQSYSTVVGNTSDWPSLNSLISNGALPTNYYANVHPSIGNYFMLTTGQVLTTDDNSTKVWNVDNIARRMLADGVSFKIYAEDIPYAGYLGGNTGLYLIRHNPFAMLSDIADNQQVATQHIVPFTQFATDLANGNLPQFSFIVPDIDDDAHNGTPLQADTWLQTKVVSPISNDPAFQPTGTGVLIVDFDEAADTDTTHGGGHVSPVFWGPLAKTGYQQTTSTLYQHQSMLRTVMQLLGLPNPPGAAASAPSMSEFFK